MTTYSTPLARKSSGRRVATNRRAEQLRQKLQQLCHRWFAAGLPSREVLERTADELEQWKQNHHVDSIWPLRPLLATATLDDGMGYGLAIIERYAKVAGLDVEPFGLLQSPQTIIHNCRRRQPALLGITVLQLDSDDALAEIGHSLPDHTLLIAGGSVFKFDPDMAARCNVDFVAADLAHFVDYLL